MKSLQIFNKNRKKNYFTGKKRYFTVHCWQKNTICFYSIKQFVWVHTQTTLLTINWICFLLYKTTLCFIGRHSWCIQTHRKEKNLFSIEFVFQPTDRSIMMTSWVKSLRADTFPPIDRSGSEMSAKLPGKALLPQQRLHQEAWQPANHMTPT